MGKIIVFNLNTEDYTCMPNYYFIGSKKGICNPLSNPFTFNGKRTSKAKLSFKTREESIEAYRIYFKTCYGQRGYELFTKTINNILKHYEDGEDIYLGCFCKPKPCHGDVIAEELQKLLIKKKMNDMRLKKMDSQQESL